MNNLNVILEGEFSCAHFYENIHESSEWNCSTFGLCYSKYGHGHNFRLEMAFEKNEELSAHEKGFSNLVMLLDHKHLNFDIPEFHAGKIIPTTENLLLWIKEKYFEQNRVLPLWIKLYENKNLWCEWTNYER